VLLRADTNHERWNIDKLFADSDVFLEDHNAGVMDGAGEVTLLDEGLKSSLKELRSSKTEDIIEFAFVVLQETKSHHSTDEGLTFKESSWICNIHSEQNTSGLSTSRERKCIRKRALSSRR